MVSGLVSHILLSALHGCMVSGIHFRGGMLAHWVTNSWLYQKSVTSKYALPTRKSVG